jgi:hypothetical protein
MAWASITRLDKPTGRWQNARVARVLMRGADEKFPVQNIHVVEFADIRDPILDLDVR